MSTRTATPAARPSAALARPAFERLAGLVRAHPFAALIAGALALGYMSLLMPSTPTYDPWAWIIWGREITQLDLETETGPSWKPFPVLFTTPFALFGDAAPYLWLGVARAGGILALFAAGRLAYRLLPGRFYGLVGALVAAGGLLASSYFLRTIWLGNSEGILLAALLGTIDRHLDGRRDQAFLLGAVAALLRPEVWLFFGLYTAWLWFAEPARRKLILIIGAIVAFLWFAPELWGSGNLLRSADRANTPNPNSPAFADQPTIALFEKTWPVLPLPFKFGAAVGLAFAGVSFLLRRRQGTVLALAAIAAAWFGVIAVMTERGFSGNPRYVMPATALACVIAGIGWSRILQAGFMGVERFVPRPRLALAAQAAVVALLLVVTWPYAERRAQTLKRVGAQLNYQHLLTAELDRAIASAGGRDAVMGCGKPSTGPFNVPQLAWLLEAHAKDVALEAAVPGMVFQTRPTRRGRPAPELLPPEAPWQRIADEGPWTVFTAGCLPPQPPRAAATRIRLG